VVDEAGAGLTSRGKESESTGLTPSGRCGGVEWGGAGTFNDSSNDTESDRSCMSADEWPVMFNEASSNGVGWMGTFSPRDDLGSNLEREISTVESARLGDACE
jgi:hypothetical protein